MHMQRSTFLRTTELLTLVIANKRGHEKTLPAGRRHHSCHSSARQHRALSHAAGLQVQAALAAVVLAGNQQLPPVHIETSKHGAFSPPSVLLCSRGVLLISMIDDQMVGINNFEEPWKHVIHPEARLISLPAEQWSRTEQTGARQHVKEGSLKVNREISKGFLPAAPGTGPQPRCEMCGCGRTACRRPPRHAVASAMQGR